MITKSIMKIVRFEAGMMKRIEEILKTNQNLDFSKFIRQAADHEIERMGVKNVGSAENQGN